MPTPSHSEQNSDRRILLADADAFYVAVARLADPDGVGTEPLLIVGGSSTRGVVTSASYEARQYGVRSAMPTAHALRLCPDAVVAPVPRELCSQKSKEIMLVLERFSPVVEPASIDEFYIDMAGTERLYGTDLAATARRIREAVFDTTDLMVSIGGGTSRLIAKLAAKRAKPTRDALGGGGAYIVPPGEESEFVSGLQLADIPMIGPKFQRRLASYGLRAVRDALRLDVAVLQQWFGRRTGRWLHDRIRGIDSGRVEAKPRAKSISHEETFFRDIGDDDHLSRELLRLAVRVASDVRRKGYRARTVTVKIRDSDFTTRQASETLSETVSADRLILETAQKLLARLRKSRRSPSRLLGVALSQLVREREAVQLSIFDQAEAATFETNKDRAVAHLIDDINTKYGRHGILRGAEMRIRAPETDRPGGTGKRETRK